MYSALAPALSRVVRGLCRVLLLVYRSLIKHWNSPLPLPPAATTTTTGRACGYTQTSEPCTEVVFSGSGLAVWYQMGVANAVRTELKGCRVSGMSGGAIAALFVAAYPSESTPEFWANMVTQGMHSAAHGISGLAYGLYDCTLKHFIPSLSPAAGRRVTDRAGVWVHDVDTGHIGALRNLACNEELARAVAASATAFLFTSGQHSHVEMEVDGRRARCNDPYLYSLEDVYRALSSSGGRKVLLLMQPPGDVPAPPNVTPIYCVNPADAKWLPNYTHMPTLAEQKHDFEAGDAWGRAFVVPRMKAALTAA
jgi:hypothetical protein